MKKRRRRGILLHIAALIAVLFLLRMCCSSTEGETTETLTETNVNASELNNTVDTSAQSLSTPDTTETVFEKPVPTAEPTYFSETITYTNNIKKREKPEITLVQEAKSAGKALVGSPVFEETDAPAPPIRSPRLM